MKQADLSLFPRVSLPIILNCVLIIIRDVPIPLFAIYMKASYPFLSSPRSFDWQRSRQINESPVLLHGTMVRHHSRESSWEGLSLSGTANCQTDSQSSFKASRYWDEFANGRRTVDPEYCGKEGKRSESRHGSAEIGYRKKGVVREGMAIRANTSSEENFLQPSRPGDSYRGLQLYRGRESPHRPSKAVSQHSPRLGVSQIATLPGRHRAEDGQKHPRSPSKKNISQITTLPGSQLSPEPQSSSYSPEKCLRKNLNSSVQVEDMIGPPVRRHSPSTLITPKRQTLAAYESLGQEVYDSRKTKGSLQAKNTQSTQEFHPHQTRKVKPSLAQDLFAPSFRLF